MNFAFDPEWVTTLWGTVKGLVSKKQDKLSGSDGQVVGFQDGEPTAQDLEQLIESAWPSGPYTFEVDSNGHLFANYTGKDERKAE